MAFSLFKKDKKSGSIAKDRLKLTLTSDRAGCSPEVMEQIKNDIIEVISKYIMIDREGLDIKVTTQDGVAGGGPTLYANIPIKNVKGK